MPNALGVELAEYGRHSWVGRSGQIDGETHETGQRCIISNQVGAETSGNLDRGIVNVQTCDANSVGVYVAACVAAIACCLLVGVLWKRGFIGEEYHS